MITVPTSLLTTLALGERLVPPSKNAEDVGAIGAVDSMNAPAQGVDFAHETGVVGIPTNTAAADLVVLICNIFVLKVSDRPDIGRVYIESGSQKYLGN